MNRQGKELIIDELRDGLLSSEASFLVVYRGLSVKKMHQLRSNLLAKDGSFKVAKARLMKRAIDGESAFDGFSEFFKDQVGLVFAKKDVAGVAKVLSDFAKENTDLQLVAGYFESKVLKKDKIIQIASLPSREVLLSRLCAVLNCPMSNLARALNMVADKRKES
jgi:large subunit ribosomal protein L10